jgi:N-methylhydantoinase A/oxoprolinase/acetone carboxylase beta subunit
MKSRYGLGIDAGGTYTDAVIMDFTSQQVVVKCKAPTTQPDPSGGIRLVLEQIDSAFLQDVSMVSLATTFATNAMVEDRGAEAGLILVGYDERPPEIPSSTRVLMINGGHTVNGEQKGPLDVARLEVDLESFIRDLDAVAVTAFFSVRNPEHEKQVARIIRDRYDLPIVRGHRLSNRLDAIKRATTALWNARLIPLISELIIATENVLSENGIGAPLMVVRGDGTLMSAQTALDRPVDTLLSGPAASILGAKHLSGLTRALIVDMGGTTTDMASLSGGKVAIDPRGAKVGKWRTHVEAAKVRTIGVGGDSLIALTRERKLTVGPRRVIPLCIVARQHPEIISMLQTVLNTIDNAPCGHVNPCTFYLPIDTGSGGERALNPGNPGAGLLNEYLQFKDTCNWFSAREIEGHERTGGVYRSSLTPTDLRVAAGRFELGDRQAARLGLAVLAKHMQVEEADCIQRVEEEISRILCLEAVSLLDDRSEAALYQLVDHWFQPSVGASNGIGFNVKVSLNAPVIGVGAPAAQCLPQTFERFDSNCLLPEAYEVSVAVGAVVGVVDRTSNAVIRNAESGGFILHTDNDRQEFSSMGDAIEAGKKKLEIHARESMKQDHVVEPLMDFSIHEKTAKAAGGENIHLETRLRLRATGRPNVGQRP